MGDVIHFPNLKAANLRSVATGTQITDASAANHACLDVFARNDAINPLYVSGVSGIRVRETRFHDAAGVNINDVSGAFVEIGTDPATAAAAPAAIANTTSKLIISSTIGEPLCIRLGANAGAAALASDLCIINRGQSVEIDVALIATNQLWIRSLTSVAVTDGILTMNLCG
jgi:hypothetical protein